MTTTIIGGEVCRQRLTSALLPSEPRALTQTEIAGLWRIFVAIGTIWENTVYDSAGLKSSWLEFLTQKTRIQPSYVAEYVNALVVVEELRAMYSTEAFAKLFLDNGLPRDSMGCTMIALDTRLGHAKHFVVDEFIRVQIVAGGFRNFIRPQTAGIRAENNVNYNGYISGSRFNRIKPVRPYEDPSQ